VRIRGICGKKYTPQIAQINTDNNKIRFVRILEICGKMIQGRYMQIKIICYEKIK
jgi:hypothetical protein